MFYPLLDLIVCPTCGGELVLVCPTEKPQTTTMRMPPAKRASLSGAPVGPLPATPASTSLWHLLAPLASTAAPPGRDREYGVVEGVLVCIQCERWYPLRDELPELLPDYLRSWDDERQWLAARQAVFTSAGLEAVWQALMARPRAVPDPSSDPGAHYKNAEIAITRRALPEGFFGPAMVAPFNPSRPHFTIDLLARYVTTVSKLGCGINGTVLDIGVGYAWTTEWLVRLGYQAIGVDITRSYVLAGYPRLGGFVPHLIIADTEHLPLRQEIVDAVLSFDAFHHLPDRPRAMRALARVMRPGARLVLVEPGKAHESHPASIAVMQQHGILERGFDQADLAGYIQGTALGSIVHHRSDTHPHDVFVVQKAGAFETDSRSPRALSAAIVVEQQAARVRVGRQPTITLSVTNTGDTTWLHATPDGWGEVHLGGSLFDDKHNLLMEDYTRVRLPRTLRPGQRLQIECSWPALRRPGLYWIEFDLVDNGMLWFKDFAYQPVQISLEVLAEPTGEIIIDAPLVSNVSARQVATELAFDPAPPKPSPAGGGPWIPLRQLPGIVWQTLRDEGPLPLIRKSWHYVHAR